jgi:hypothetical protein
MIRDFIRGRIPTINLPSIDIMACWIIDIHWYNRLMKTASHWSIWLVKKVPFPAVRLCIPRYKKKPQGTGCGIRCLGGLIIPFSPVTLTVSQSSRWRIQGDPLSNQCFISKYVDPFFLKNDWHVLTQVITCVRWLIGIIHFETRCLYISQKRKKRN